MSKEITELDAVQALIEYELYYLRDSDFTIQAQTKPDHWVVRFLPTRLFNDIRIVVFDLNTADPVRSKFGIGDAVDEYNAHWSVFDVKSSSIRSFYINLLYKKSAEKQASLA